MASMYFPIKNHGGIPNMLDVHGGISIKHLVKDTCVGKKKAELLPHLIANTVDDLARGRAERNRVPETKGDVALTVPGKARGLVTKTKTKLSVYEELAPEEKESRAKHKNVRMRQS